MEEIKIILEKSENKNKILSENCETLQKELKIESEKLKKIETAHTEHTIQEKNIEKNMEENFQKKIENDEKESTLQKNNFILKIDNQNNLIKDLETKITFLENVLSQNKRKENEEENIKFNQKQEINRLNEQILNLERELENFKISSTDILSKQKNEIELFFEEKLKIMSVELEAAKKTNTVYEIDYHRMRAAFDSTMESMRKTVEEHVAVPVAVSVGVGVVRSEAPLSGNGRESGHGSGNGSGGGSGGGSEDNQTISILQSQVLSFKQQLNK